jgi:hypothetical protein
MRAEADRAEAEMEQQREWMLSKQKEAEAAARRAEEMKASSQDPPMRDDRRDAKRQKKTVTISTERNETTTIPGNNPRQLYRISGVVELEIFDPLFTPTTAND